MKSDASVTVGAEFCRQWAEAIGHDSQAMVRGGRCSLDLCVYYGDTPWLLAIRQGVLISTDRGPWHMRSADLVVRASEAAWQAFWSPTPKPGFHDLLAMSSYGHARIEGDMELFRCHLGYIKGLLSAPRHFIPRQVQDGC